MQNNTLTYTTKIFLNAEEAKKQLDTLEKKVDDLRQKKEEAAEAGEWKEFNKIKKELDQTTRQIDTLNTSAQKISNTLDHLDTASVKQIQQTVKAINAELKSGAIERGSDEWKFLNEQLQRCNKELKSIRNEAKAAEETVSPKEDFFTKLTHWNQVGILFNNIFGYSSGLQSLIGSVKDLANESIELAGGAEGVEMAFARINKPGMLDNLREATHGTVNDLELMKQAVKFEDFNLPAEQLGTFLAYAQQKANDTGESVDYLVNSIVTGLGRKSLPILDNLGLSATEIREEMKATGDMTAAVANIIERNMAAAGGYVETAADRAAQATARQQNAMMELGKELLPLKESLGDVFNTITIGTVDTLKWLVQHRKILYSIATAVTTYTIAVNASVMATKAQAAATWLAEKAQRALNLAQKANPWGLLAAGIAAAVTAIIAFADKTQETSRCVDALTHAQEEANNQYVEQESRIRVLDRVLHDNNQSLEERRSALMRLKEIIPGYNAMLSREGELINDNRIAIDEYLKSLKKEIMVKAYKDEMVELYKQQRELEKQRQGLIAGYDTQNVGNGQTVKTPRFENLQDLTKYKELGEEMLDIENTIKRMMDDISKTSATMTQAVEESAKEQPKSQKGGGTAADPYQTDLKKLEENQKQAQYVLRLNHEQGQMADEEYHRRSYESEMRFYADKLELQERHGKSQVDTQNSILDRMAAEATRLQREQQERMRTELAMADDAYQADQAALTRMYLDGAIATEKEYNQRKLEAEEDYYRQRLAIIQKYDGDTQDAESNIQQLELSRLMADRKKRAEELEKALKEATTAEGRNAVNEQMYAQDLISFEQYQQRKVEIAQQAAERRKEITQQLYQEVSKTMQAASSLFSAIQSAEVAKAESRYDRQIEAARKAGKDTTKLEKKKEAEVNAIKAKYADKEFQMKVLSIVADTAVGISKLWTNPGYPWAIPLTALVAAQGAMQLATAKKAQQQAQEQGYYEGGFTGGRRYKKEAGVVHEGEFVANHQAVQNPAVLPFLNFLDQAQRNNTVGSLTMQDVSRSVGGGSTQVVAPIVNVQTDNEQLREAVDAHREATERLLDRLDEGIESYTVIDGPKGLYQSLKKYENLIKKH